MTRFFDKLIIRISSTHDKNSTASLKYDGILNIWSRTVKKAGSFKDSPPPPYCLTFFLYKGGA